jgi:hypothetical protein
MLQDVATILKITIAIVLIFGILFMAASIIFMVAFILVTG